MIPANRLFIYGYPVRANEQGQAFVIFGFKLDDAVIVREDGKVLIGPVQRISYN